MKLRFVRVGPLAALLAICGIVPARAEREPVLKQIQVPHSYYYREMYLPQVTSGPAPPRGRPTEPSSSTRCRARCGGRSWDRRRPCSSRTGRATTTSRTGRPTGSGSSIRRTATTRSSSGCWSSRRDARRPWSANGAANLDARWSPDGSKVAYVSTAFHGRFHVFVAPGRERRSRRARPSRDHGRARQRAAALLLLEVRPVPLPHLVPRREGADPRSPTGATSGARAISGGWRRGPARRCAWSARKRPTGRPGRTGREMGSAWSTARTSAGSATSSG